MFLNHVDKKPVLFLTRDWLYMLNIKYSFFRIWYVFFWASLRAGDRWKGNQTETFKIYLSPYMDAKDHSYPFCIWFPHVYNLLIDICKYVNILPVNKYYITSCDYSVKPEMRGRKSFGNGGGGRIFLSGDS